ncbi:hypothetical protein ACFYM5_05060 [Streptomyces sp. NPDC006706]|uniref:hypothetical protein n=1 Tax=Streptomyces sp. NPDC006706 TaxID=3364761 RepID=UPI003680B9A0
MAVYAVRPKQVAEIQLDDLNRSTGRLRIRRPNRLDHEIYLDDFALQHVKDWLIERHQRWPLSTNPYLIVSPITALHVDRPAVGPSNFKALRDRIGINPTQPAKPPTRSGWCDCSGSPRTSRSTTSARLTPSASPSIPPRPSCAAA